MMETMDRLTCMMSPDVENVLRNVDVSAPVTGMPLQKSLRGITAIAPIPTTGKRHDVHAKTPKQ